MEYKLVIDGTLPNLNDYIGKLNISKFRGNELKKQSEKDIAQFIKRHLRGVRITRPVFIQYLWVEPSQKRDLDNICSFGMKVIQDSLVHEKVLLNDGWKNIIGFSHAFEVDAKNPRIEVRIQECE